ncbi:UDP-glucuronosyltransferase 2A1-like [Elysia marginata]|uniref:UDP-glucuronosyltransferase 2A1-like n=1 Tax=Elysia marginata TaxID=1093978 RepID=A0AAV4FJQ8_9GAST|nr:UDP-glucuronosyltransferase 2A1-like [Elysia marginata]
MDHIKTIEAKLEATEMWFLRRMLRISWTEKKSNETIRKRQATFLGHVMRREKLEHLIKLDGKRGREKQREKMMDGLKRWLGSGSSTETMTAMGHRELWRNTIADASKHGTG